MDIRSSSEDRELSMLMEGVTIAESYDDEFDAFDDLLDDPEEQRLEAERQAELERVNSVIADLFVCGPFPVGPAFKKHHEARVQAETFDNVEFDDVLDDILQDRPLPPDWHKRERLLDRKSRNKAFLQPSMQPVNQETAVESPVKKEKDAPDVLDSSVPVKREIKEETPCEIPQLQHKAASETPAFIGTLPPVTTAPESTITPLIEKSQPVEAAAETPAPLTDRCPPIKSPDAGVTTSSNVDEPSHTETSDIKARFLQQKRSMKATETVESPIVPDLRTFRSSKAVETDSEPESLDIPQSVPRPKLIAKPKPQPSVRTPATGSYKAKSRPDEKPTAHQGWDNVDRQFKKVEHYLDDSDRGRYIMSLEVLGNKARWEVRLYEHDDPEIIARQAMLDLKKQGKNVTEEWYDALVSAWELRVQGLHAEDKATAC